MTTFAERPVVLCIVTGTEGYGVRQVWSDIINGLTVRNWKVVVAVLDAAHAEPWRSAYPQARVAPAPTRNETVKVSSGRWRKLFSMVKRARGQISHAGWLTRLARESGAKTLIIQSPPESLLAGIIARRTGIRALWLVPNVIGSDVPFDLNRRIYRLIFRLGKVVPVSNSCYTDSTFGTGSFERHVAHLGVDIDRFRPGGDSRPVRNAFGIPADGLVIGLFARMTSSKGQDRLVEAMALSKTPFHLLLCGGPLEDAYVEGLRRRVEVLKLGGRVHFAGPQSDLRPYYAASDIVANLYLHAEGFGLTLVEAMACAKPVLAHGLGGPAEIVTDGESGWVLPTVDVPTIALHLEKVFRDRTRWNSMGQAAFERAHRNFKKDLFVDRIDRLARSNAMASLSRSMSSVESASHDLPASPLDFEDGNRR